MDLVDDDEAQIMKERRDLHVLVDQQGFQRFRRDLQDAAGMLEQLALLAVGSISMPLGDRDVRFLAE